MLTERQLEVLKMYLISGTIPATAKALGIHQSTTTMHIQSVKQKLGAKTAHDLLPAAVKAGLVRLEWT